ncbi:MAG: presenilin family intramembrane aspartyl protease PSH [Candidatus Thermoplasmatota archaeon]
MPAGMKKLQVGVQMACSFLIVQILALALAGLFMGAGFQAFENPNDPVNPLLYLVAILLFTGIVLLIVRLGKGMVIRYLILGATALVLLDVFMILFAYGIFFVCGAVALLWEAALLSGAVLAAVLTYLLYRHPEWYVVNAVGILMGAGVASIMGISLGILPVMVLLVSLAVYDAIAVYRTKHMISLADALTEQHLPVLLVFPKSKDYSFMAQKGIKKELKSGREREAVMMGLGDVIIPSVLAVSAFTFLPGRSLFVALGTMVGILCGFTVLLHLLRKGKPQAGLPPLNIGAILGYVISYLLVYGDLTMGMTMW